MAYHYGSFLLAIYVQALYISCFFTTIMILKLTGQTYFTFLNIIGLLVSQSICYMNASHIIDTSTQCKLMIGLEGSVRRRNTFTFKRALSSNTLSCLLAVICCFDNFQNDAIKSCNLMNGIIILLNTIMIQIMLPPALMWQETNEKNKIVIFQNYNEKKTKEPYNTSVGRGYGRIEEFFGFFCNITVYSLRVFSLFLFLILAIALSIQISKLEQEAKPRDDFFPKDYGMKCDYLDKFTIGHGQFEQPVKIKNADCS